MKYRWFPATWAGLAMMILILDTRTALSAGSEGIRLCLQTVIPCLFPFLLLSSFLTASLSDAPLPFSGPLAKWLRIPKNGICAYLIGLLGGYPAGAQAVSSLCKSGQINQQEAGRMVAFCNNAGPAFFFGIGMVVFENAAIGYLLWGIQILSSLLCAMLFPVSPEAAITSGQTAKKNAPPVMRQCVENMALICGWVMVFKILLTFLQRWFLWMLPDGAQILFSGLLEMTNGCCQLVELPLLGQKLLFFTLFASFGGICILMQTYAVTTKAKVPMQCYLPGKLLQLSISLFLCCMAQFLLPASQRAFPPLFVGILCGMYVLVFLRLGRKKGVAFPIKLMYNEENHRMRGNHYAVSQEN